MVKYSVNYVINHIEDLSDRLNYVENNIQYIKVLQALKLWLIRFNEMLTDEEWVKSVEYEKWFFTGCGFSFFDRVNNSIIEYENGNKPF